MIAGNPQGYSGSRKREGFMKEIRKYSRIIIFEAPPTFYSRSNTFTVARSLLKQNSDIKAVFAFSDPMAFGVADAVKFCNYRKLLIVGFDGSKQGIDAIKDGRIDASITQCPYDIGKTGLETILKHLNGDKISPRIYTKTELITRETLKMPFR